MPALMISTVRPKDQGKLAAYAAAAGKTLAEFGGELIHRGSYHSTLLGMSTPHGTGIIRFPDAEAATAWFNSPAYRELAELRDAAADMTFVLYTLPA